MGKLYLQSLRLALALVCVGASLILGAHWFGLVPDHSKRDAAARRHLSETIAINTAGQVRRKQWVDLKLTLQTLVDRNPELLSIGVRSNTMGLKVDTGHHEEIWGEANGGVGVDLVEVPINLNRIAWGQVELCFQTSNATTHLGQLAEHPLVRLLSFFLVAGLLAYTIFVAKVLNVFNNTQVVPDRVRQALDTLAEGLLVLDENGRIVLANDAFAKTVGVPANYLTEMLAGALPWEFADGRVGEEYPWMISIDKATIQTERMLNLQVDGDKRKIFSVNSAPLGGDGSRRGALATFRDVTHIEEHRAELETMLSMLRSSRDEIERKNKELEILATQDALTGCLNRRAFFEKFGVAWVESKRTGIPLSCVMIDNDHFKKVNDTYGHAVGDDVLRRVASTLRKRHNGNGIVCRYGGEEFCVLLPNCDFETALHEAELTRQAIQAITFDEPAGLTLTASIGVSETRFGALDPQELINQADVCLYTAKRNGRNCVVPYDHEMEELDGEAAPDDRGDIDLPYQAVTALVSTLSYRDTNTAEHSRRVADLCTRVATGMMSPQEVSLLEVAALLHDIGKVGIPDHILLKPGPLTDDEWQIMSRHDRIGVEIVENAFGSSRLTEIVESHHAFYGGKGRNEDLPVGDAIPAAARLLTICDSYDAMVSDRVYRKGRTHEEAIAELRRCAPFQFDPKLVERFAEVIPDNKANSAQSAKNEAAIQIGYQIERLVAAIDKQDTKGMQTLATRLSHYATHCDMGTIADAAQKIERRTSSETIQWLDLLRDTNELLDVCRSTQSELLRESLGSSNVMSP